VYEGAYQWCVNVFVFSGVYEGEYQWRMEVFMLSGVYDGTSVACGRVRATGW